VACRTNSFGAGTNDVWVLKLDSSGNIAWQKTYGGPGESEASCIRPTLEGGYIVSGRIGSFMGESRPAVYGTSVSDEISSVVPEVSPAVPIDTYVIPQNSLAKTYKVCGPPLTPTSRPFFSIQLRRASRLPFTAATSWSGHPSG
jgi:hypothetical protein